MAGLNILHEMLEAMKDASDLVRPSSEHRSGFFYSTVWLGWRTPVDGDDVAERSYPLRSHRRSIFKRSQPDQRGFLQGLNDEDPAA